jgi:hypothetical protein
MTRRRAPGQHILVFTGRTEVDALPGEGQLRRQAGSADAPSPSPSTTTEVQLRWVSLPREVIVLAVRCYLRYELSYRDVENCSLSEAYPSTRHHLPLGAAVHPAVDRRRPTLLACRRRSLARRRNLKIAGRWVYLYWAVDQYRAAHRCSGVREAGPSSHPPVLHPRLAARPTPQRDDPRPRIDLSPARSMIWHPPRARSWTVCK